MPSDFTIKAVVGEKSWEGNYGRMLDYELAVDDLSETVTLTQKPETPAPYDGQVIYGHLEDGKFGKKLKKDQRDNGSQPASKGSGDDYARRPDHPDNVARMKHTSALSAAPKYYEVLRTDGVIAKPTSKDHALATLRGLIEWLEGSYPTNTTNDQAF